MQTSSKTPHRILTPQLQTFYDSNPDFDLLSFDFFDKEALGQIKWPKGLDADATLPTLMTHQRVLSVYPNSYVGQSLIEKGFDSANKIASIPEEEFVSATRDIFDNDLQSARTAYRKAATIKGQTQHLWANVHSIVASSHSRSMRASSVGDEIIDFFASLPTYESLFGTLDYCECEHCKSIFGPAAYFVDLMRITDRYITQPNTIPDDLTLESRRKYLFEMPLTCANTNDLVPYIQIVNEVLADRAAHELDTEDVYNALALTVYPFNLPMNILLNEIRLYIDLLGTSLAEVYLTFSPFPTGDSVPNIAVAREFLGLSIEQYQLVKTPTPNETDLKKYYGLVTQPLSALDEEGFFLLQTGLTRDGLDGLLIQNLNKAELAAGLAHDFFFNTPLPAPDYVHVESSDTGPNQVKNLTLNTLDRINRFVRLSQWTAIGYADLDWMFTSVRESEITEVSIRKLARIKEASVLYGLAPDVMAAFWYDLKTIGVGYSQYPEDLFDRVYNNPSLLKGEGPYHPIYDKNPLYQDPVVTWDIESTERVGSEFGRPRLMAALGLSDTALTALGQALFGENAKVPLTVTNLSQLYRTTRILASLKLSLDDFLTLASLLDIDPTTIYEPDDLILFYVTNMWLRLNELSVSDLNYIITGQSSEVTTYPSEIAIEYNFMKTIWTLAQPTLLTPTSFTADLITEDQSKEAFKELLNWDDPQLIVSVRTDYQTVFKKKPPTNIAIVLKPVDVEELEFLKDKNFDDEQIEIIAKVLLATYDSQIELLNTQFSSLLETSTEILTGLLYYVAQTTPIEPFIQMLLTPVPECTDQGKSRGRCKEFSEGWKAIMSLIQQMLRATFTATALRLNAAELVNMADFPAAYGITTPLEPTLKAVRSARNLKRLEEAFNDTEEALLEYLAMEPDSECEGGEKSQALSDLTGWPQPQICRLTVYLGQGTSIYDTVDGIVRMKQGFDILSRTGLDAFFIENLLKLQDLTASEGANWNTYQETATSIVAVANAKYEETWTEVNGKIVSKLNENKRDALEWLVLWQLRQTFPTFTSPRQLYQFLLIDVETSGCAQTSYIVEGLNAVQLYLQRCRLNLEAGVDHILVPQVWWEWMMNYRIWEANRKIFVYPENYLIPSLRKSKTSLFKKLEDSLLQGEIKRESVEGAFLGYLDGLSALTTLTYVDAYECIVDDGIRGPVETLFLFSRTRAEPYTYYYNSKEKDSVWAEWKTIDITISSQYVSPVYAFSRLFIFWVELSPTSSSQIKTEGQQAAPVSKNQVLFTAAVKYSFYDFTGNWVAPQTLYEERVVYVAPSTTPFNDASGYQLFNMNSLYWRKANILHVTEQNLTGPPENTSASEKIIVFYGPFLENNLGTTGLTVPPPPSPTQATENPPKYVFDLNVYNKALDVNQAVAGSVRGSIPLNNAQVINNDLNKDFLMRSTEFLLLAQNRSSGIPSAIAPKLDVALSTLNVSPSYNVIKTNYYGDYTSDISTAIQPTPVNDLSFKAKGMNNAVSAGVYNDLSFHGVLGDDGKVSSTFSLNTDLSYLFAAEQPQDKAQLIAVVQEILLTLRAKNLPAQQTSFILSEINDFASRGVYNDLKNADYIIAGDFVNPRVTSSTDLSFLFAGAPEEQKVLLISEVRRVLFAHMGEPMLLGTTAKDIARTIMVKNQPSTFILNNGDEAFLIMPDILSMPAINLAMRVSDISSEPTVYDYSFVTQDITLDESKSAYAQLKNENIISAQGKLSADFGPLTDLSFLFPAVAQPKRSLMIAEVREVLLTLASITALRYYYENDDFFIDDKTFITYGIDAASSAEVYAQLRAEGIVDAGGLISKQFTATTDLSFLFPDENPQTRDLLIAEVRAILLQYYEATWRRNIFDLKFKFIRLTTGAVPRLSRSLFTGGIDSLLSLKSQQIPVVPELPFTRYKPDWRVIPPAQFDGTQVDFDGPYGLYYWELFFFSPQLIAWRLSADRRFDDAQKWYQYIFNPTIREIPLGPASFLTPDISRTESEQAYGQLKTEGIITQDDEVSKEFNEKTYLGFLWPQIPTSPKKDLMIREVRNVLLNYQVSKPSSRYWQFQPFRNHKLQSLRDILTDKAQIAIYNNDPFDPFAIARLRIGSFEKAIVMDYLDNLIAWGDATFALYTWESLTAATMLYMYAYDLLGERPVNVGACPSQPPTNFASIREKYEGASGGIPEFLIDMENLLPANDILAPELFGKPFNEIDAYFCVPENEKMLAYWDIVDDRLYKIRNCLDLEGKPLVLPLFAPPINPLDLVRAAASGQSASAVVERQSASIAPYRFTYMLNQARTLAQTVTQLGNSLLAAYSSRDNEALARLRANQDLAILNLTTQVKTQQIEIAKLGVEALQESADAIKNKSDYYDKLLKEYLSPAEILNIEAAAYSLVFKVAAQIAQTASSIAYMAPNVGSPFAMTYGGIQIGNSLAKFASNLEAVGQVSEFIAQTSLTVAGYQRRAQEWQLQYDQAGFEAAQVQKQIEAAQVQVQSATRELEIHMKSIEQAKEIQDFLFKKFDSQELYSWIAMRISTLYFQAYKLALDAALSAQSAYRYELNVDDNFINFNYWDSLKSGLLAGEGLEASINQMERSYVQKNARRLEIIKNVSLMAIAPAELERLKTTGACTIKLSEALFDFDYPGLYCRQIKTIGLYLDTGEDSPGDINAILTQIKNDLVLEPSEEAVSYLLNPTGNPPLSVRQNWQSRQQIALSNSDSPNGLFELSFYDDRYLPFEGTGAVSEWTFQMPLETNHFDYMMIRDVILTVGYTALNGGSVFKGQVEQLLAGDKFQATAYINLKENYPDEWEAFMSNHDEQDTQTFEFYIDAWATPFNVKNVSLNMVYFQLDVPRTIQMPASSEFMNLTVVEETEKPIKLSGQYGHVTYAQLPQDKFEGAWTIVVDLVKMRNDPKLRLLLLDNYLDPDAFQNLEMILDYKACVFKCT